MRLPLIGSWLVITTLFSPLALAVSSPSAAPDLNIAAPAAGAPTTAQTIVRVKYLQGLLDSESRLVQLRTWSWVGTYVLVTVGQLVAIHEIKDEGTRTSLWVGSASSLIGALGLAVVPLNVPSGAGLPADPDAALVELRRRLHVGAEKERFGSSWISHVGNAVVNAAIGLILGLGYHQWESAGISFGVGFGVGEITILPQPTHLIQAEDSWNGTVLVQAPVKLVPMLTAHGGGLGLAVPW
jgi:hypothetical protein